MDFFDSHCHLDMEPLVSEQGPAIERAAKASVVGMINVGASMRGSKRSVDLANLYPNIWASVGLHPHEAEMVTSVDLVIEELKTLLENDKVVAVGEIGLDYYDHATQKEVAESIKKAQKQLFEKQLDLAQELKKPVILHIRDAWDDAFKILSKKGGISGVVHCFTGTKEEVKKVLGLGLYIGFTGFITFDQEKFNPIRGAVKVVPLENLLIETDAPFLAPEPYRGKTNEPSYVVEVAKKMAELKTVSLEEVAEASVKNCKKVFNIGS
jgi:TatD DNase family protein